ncbi:MAG: hypothetical protein P1U38_02610 [Aeromicrobium sp.]|uniref:hypothetical protein n=1 Tax=Aeromicrobium sp. TaxID=1871063 RepID=UPI0026283E92|nr:hypothetical protein [Aeromicrobium sp.]MDF1703644.1 hypothetical protein [Aeromicrobium sp.]
MRQLARSDVLSHEHAIILGTVVHTHHRTLQTLSHCTKTCRAHSIDDGQVQIITVDSLDDLRRAEKVLHTVWDAPGGHPPVTLDLLRAFTHLGGLVCAAVVDDSFVAASVAVPSAEPRVLYSLATGVIAPFTGRKIGLRLKQHQRDVAREHHYERIRWTFDPWIRTNAHFNLLALGARVVDYRADFFGQVHDAFSAGAPTDRVVVDWPVDPATPAAQDDARGAVVVETGPDGAPAVVTDSARTWIRVPADIIALRTTDVDQAVEWTQIGRRYLSPAASRGDVCGFTPDGWFVLRGTP